MLYEKSSRAKVTFNNANLTIAALALIITVEASYLLLPETFWGPIKLLDVINALAQFATAGAFYLGFHQFRKNTETERQSALVSECKSLISKMQDTISQIKLGDEARVSNLSNSIAKLSNIAIDFNAIFEELNEDIHKAIVRMHWQDMYFNNFSHTMKQIELRNILIECGVPPGTYIQALAKAKKDIEPNEPFYQYLIMSSIINTETVSYHFKPNGRIESNSPFNLYFFDNKQLNYLLYGCMNIIDIRIKSPALAAVFERLKKINPI